MSIFFQYYVLQKILSASYKNAKLPDSTSMPYKTIRPLKRLSKIRKYRIIDKIVLFSGVGSGELVASLKRWD